MYACAWRLRRGSASVRNRSAGPSSGPAPLAQSAERFHGKEKVVSSILTGGSRRIRRRRAVHQPGPTGPLHGGVAQLVRALGS